MPKIKPEQPKIKTISFDDAIKLHEEECKKREEAMKEDKASKKELTKKQKKEAKEAKKAEKKAKAHEKIKKERQVELELRAKRQGTSSKQCLGAKGAASSSKKSDIKKGFRLKQVRRLCGMCGHDGIATIKVADGESSPVACYRETGARKAGNKSLVENAKHGKGSKKPHIRKSGGRKKYKVEGNEDKEEYLEDEEDEEECLEDEEDKGGEQKDEAKRGDQKDEEEKEENLKEQTQEEMHIVEKHAEICQPLGFELGEAIKKPKIGFKSTLDPVEAALKLTFAAGETDDIGTNSYTSVGPGGEAEAMDKGEKEGGGQSTEASAEMEMNDQAAGPSTLC